VRRLQVDKYGWQLWVAEGVSAAMRWVRHRPPEEAMFLEITPLAAAEHVPDSRAA